MANQKAKSGRRRAARPPVIEAEATEITEDAAKKDDKSSKPPSAASSKQAEPSAKDKKTSEKPAANAAAGKDEKQTQAKPSGASAKEPEETGGGRGLKVAGIAALAVAIAVGGAWLYREYGTQYFPPEGAQQQAEAIEALTKRIGSLEAEATSAKEVETSLRAEIDQLKANVQEASVKAGEVDLSPALTAAKKAQARADEALAQAREAAKAAATASKGLAGAVAEIGSIKKSIDEAAKAVSTDEGKTGEALKAAQMQLSALNIKMEDALKRIDTQAAANRSGDVDTLSQSVAALQASVKSLSDAQAKLSAEAEKSAEAGAQSTALAASLTSLRQKLSTGAPFGAELATVAQAMPDDPALKTLLPLAEKGVPSADSLIAAFAGVAEKVSDAASIVPSEEQPEESGGFFTRIQKRLGAIVKVRPAGATNWQAIATRMSADAGRGDLAAMVGHLDGVSETPPEPLAVWLASARKRLEADAAFNGLSANAMARAAAAGKTGG